MPRGSTNRREVTAMGEPFEGKVIWHPETADIIGVRRVLPPTLSEKGNFVLAYTRGFQTSDSTEGIVAVTAGITQLPKERQKFLGIAENPKGGNGGKGNSEGEISIAALRKALKALPEAERMKILLKLV